MDKEGFPYYSSQWSLATAPDHNVWSGREGISVQFFQPKSLYPYVLSLSNFQGGGSYGCGHIIRYQGPQGKPQLYILHPVFILQDMCTHWKEQRALPLLFTSLSLLYVHGCVRMCGWVCVCVHTREVGLRGMSDFRTVWHDFQTVITG